MSKTPKRAVIYARLSQSSEESVSIKRQLEAGRAYAAARGWEVVGEHVDDGVSATYNQPEDRKGWGALLASPVPFDVIIVWKLDRLSRRIVDFWRTWSTLDNRKLSLASVEEQLDTSSTVGQIVISVLIGFAQMEAEAISARVRAARAYIIRNGRWAGGKLPYGYRHVPNPDGAGYVVVQDEAQIPWVREMARRTRAGLTIHSTVKWLDAQGVPTSSWPGVPYVLPTWGYATVDRLMRHPLLAGMIPYNPDPSEDDKKGKRRGDAVLLADDGHPIVDESLAIMPLDQWRAMQVALAEPNPHRLPKASRRKHSGLLSGLVWCGDPRHDKPRPMHRGTVGSASGPRPAYTCGGKGGCHQTISNFEHLVVDRFLAERGDLIHLNMVEVVTGGGVLEYDSAAIALAQLGKELPTAAGDRVATILAEMARLKEVQEDAKGRPATVELVPVGGESKTFAEDWADAEGDEETRRLILSHALTRIVVRRGAQGAWTDKAKLARLTFEWRPAGQVDVPTDAELAAWAEDDPAMR